MHITFGIFLDIIIILTLGALVVGIFMLIRGFFDFFLEKPSNLMEVNKKEQTQGKIP